MKWKLYQLCCWYNIAAVVLFSCLFVYYFAKEAPADEMVWLLLILTAAFLVAAKNWIGIKFISNLCNGQVHRDRMGLVFYLLWLFNLVGVIAYLVLMYYTLRDFSFDSLRYKPVFNLGIMAVTTIAIPTFVYTICLDIPLERKARKRTDFAEGLLQPAEDY